MSDRDTLWLFRKIESLAERIVELERDVARLKEAAAKPGPSNIAPVDCAGAGAWDTAAAHVPGAGGPPQKILQAIGVGTLTLKGLSNAVGAVGQE